MGKKIVLTEENFKQTLLEAFVELRDSNKMKALIISVESTDIDDAEFIIELTVRRIGEMRMFLFITDNEFDCNTQTSSMEQDELENSEEEFIDFLEKWFSKHVEGFEYE